MNFSFQLMLFIQFIVEVESFMTNCVLLLLFCPFIWHSPSF
jgi:hypothetical protein